MNTYTDAQIAALVAAGIDLNEFFGAPAPTVPAPEAPAPAPAQDAAPAPKVLTRSAWKAARMTRSGTVRKAFAGLTREQALEAGLLPGYVLPKGTMRASMAAKACAECGEGAGVETPAGDRCAAHAA